MTSATGSPESYRSRSEIVFSAGFTMVELLVTISLIVFLMSMLAVTFGPMLKRADQANTTALISRVSLLIDGYHSVTGNFPSDGLEGRDVITSEGTFLTGGAALTFALTQPLILTEKQANGDIRVIGEEPAIGEFRSDELSRPSDGDAEARQILDGWAEPIHYDDVSNGDKSFNPQDLGETHLDWDDEIQVHSLDPREHPQNNNEYDLWSHGSSGHTEEEVIEDLIKNWQGGEE
ncbi:MAG: hypothetical protein CMJ95_12460 [Planctomycetes bacterium]|nr:hypothetical protein [Planctomycetota bacterium]